MRRRYRAFASHVARPVANHVAASDEMPALLSRPLSNSRFGPALVRLANMGQLDKQVGPAIGAWRYNSTISYWARPGRPKNRTLTWEAFCKQIDRDPDWTDEDRAAAT